ncbi:carboxypeptidase A2-like protein, partial [Dinothrombium tinctorium]
ILWRKSALRLFLKFTILTGLTALQPEQYICLDKASGVSFDWVFDEIGFNYSFAIEMRDRGLNGFVLPKSEIISAASETWQGIKTVLFYLLERNQDSLKPNENKLKLFKY